MTLLEVCVDDLGRAREALPRAQRLEYCGRLDLDGITPPWDELAQLVRETSIPIHAMIRPSRAGSFLYDGPELESMGQDIERALDCGARGLVLGALDSKGHIDHSAMQRLLERSGDTPLTFHRAFDAIDDKPRALETLIDLGVTRLLTAGGPGKAWENRESLRSLVHMAGDRLIVMPGGGVRQDHVQALIEYTGAREVHSSIPLHLPS